MKIKVYSLQFFPLFHLILIVLLLQIHILFFKNSIDIRSFKISFAEFEINFALYPSPHDKRSCIGALESDIKFGNV